MSRFPRTEPEIAALALLVSQGLAQATEDFPPPRRSRRLSYRPSWTRTTRPAPRPWSPRGPSGSSTATKDQALEDLVDSMKADLPYAEITVRDRLEKLNQLGWGSRRDASSLKPPGEVQDIRIVSEGDTWVILGWNPPVDGGPVGAYKIQRRKRDGGSWEDIGSSVDTEELLSNQPRGIEFDYRVIAVNKAGAGQPSVTVTVVL